MKRKQSGVGFGQSHESKPGLEGSANLIKEGWRHWHPQRRNQPHKRANETRAAHEVVTSAWRVKNMGETKAC